MQPNERIQKSLLDWLLNTKIEELDADLYEYIQDVRQIIQQTEQT